MAEEERRAFTWRRQLGHARWVARRELALIRESPEGWLVQSFPTSVMTKVEDVARFGTLVMPASHGIWLAELGSSICGLLGLWREVVLRRPAGSGPRPADEAFLAFQRERRRRPARHPAALLLLALSTLRKVEVLCEMVVVRKARLLPLAQAETPPQPTSDPARAARHGFDHARSGTSSSPWRHSRRRSAC